MTSAQAPAQPRDQVPVLSVHRLVKRFGAVTAIDDVTLDVYRSEVLGIVGDNGAGKSTFLSLLSGYYHPDSGEFRYRGGPGPHHLARPVPAGTGHRDGLPGSRDVA